MGSIKRVNSSIAINEKTPIIITGANDDGTPGTGTVNLSTIGGSVTGSVALGTKSFIGAEGSITGLRTFSVQYPISNMTFLQGHFH